MNTIKQFTGTCTECGQPITPADNQIQFNRNRGLHMKAAHGIAGGYLARRAKQQAAALSKAEQKGTWNRKPLLMTPDAIAKRAYQAEWRRKNKPGKRAFRQARIENLDKARKARWDRHRLGQATATATTNGTLEPAGQAAAVPCKLSECPVCHSRFYVVRGTA